MGEGDNDDEEESVIQEIFSDNSTDILTGFQKAINAFFYTFYCSCDFAENNAKFLELQPSSMHDFAHS